MRARGLKLGGLPKDTRQIRVAPHAGAWIETNIRPRKCRYDGVAPRNAKELFRLPIDIP